MFRLFFALVLLGLIVSMCFGFLGALHPAFDTISHFRWHLSILLLLACVLGLLMKIKRAPFILMLFALVGIWQSDAGNRVQFFADANSNNLEGRKYSLLHFNLRFDNPKKDEVIDLITGLNPDLVLLNEVSKNWTPWMQKLAEKYLYSFHCPEWRAVGGSVVFSNFPLRSDKDYCHAYAAAGFTEFQIGNTWIELGTVHMRWPWPASGPRQLSELKPRLGQISQDALVVGDFNATTWSHALRQFANFGGLKISRGFGGTWMHELLPPTLAPLLGLPIDNALFKGKVTILKIQSLQPIGSDHLPLWIEFDIQEDR